MRVVGIDPGLGGGIAYSDHSGILVVSKMPDTELGIWRLIKQIAPDAAYIELVHAMPTNGCIGNFKLGKNFGALLCALNACGAPVTQVSSVLWQKAFQPLPKGSGKARTARKKAILESVRGRYPGKGITLATADAVAIWEYGLRDCA